MNIERPRWAVNGTITKQPLSAVLYRVYGPARQMPPDVLCLLDRLENRAIHRDL